MNKLNHIAIIPNGNRTWARKNNLPETQGHKVGLEKIAELTKALRKQGIHTLTIWGLSTENFKSRNKSEISGLMKLLVYAMNKWSQEAHEDGVRIIHLGRKDLLPKKAQDLLSYWEEKTINNNKYVLNIAFGYGGHDELLRAFAKAYEDLVNKKITIQDLHAVVGKYNEKYPIMGFTKYLDTKDQPYPFPDLIIRSASEYRLSGFMPWQSVYAEYYSTPELFPEFTEETIKKAIESFHNRNRKFGGN